MLALLLGVQAGGGAADAAPAARAAQDQGGRDQGRRRRRGQRWQRRGAAAAAARRGGAGAAAAAAEARACQVMGGVCESVLCDGWRGSVRALGWARWRAHAREWRRFESRRLTCGPPDPATRDSPRHGEENRTSLAVGGHTAELHAISSGSGGTVR